VVPLRYSFKQQRLSRFWRQSFERRCKKSYFTPRTSKAGGYEVIRLETVHSSAVSLWQTDSATLTKLSKFPSFCR